MPKIINNSVLYIFGFGLNYIIHFIYAYIMYILDVCFTYIIVFFKWMAPIFKDIFLG